MSSPSQSINVLENLQALERQNAQHLDSNGNPVATLHDTSITVASWQNTSVFGPPNSQVFPTSFFDDSAPGPRENQPIVISSDTESILNQRTETASTPSSLAIPSPKKKVVIIESDDDSDIYASEPESKPLPPSILKKNKFNLRVDTSSPSGKAKDVPAIGEAGSSKQESPKKKAEELLRLETDPRKRAAMLKRQKEVEEAMTLLEEHRASLQLPLQTTAGSGTTNENTTNPSVDAPEPTSYKFDYVAFYNATKTSTDTMQMCQQMKDHQEIHNGLILNENYRHIQEHFEPIAQRSIQLQQELLDTMVKLQEIQTEQRHLTEQVVDLSESIGQQARRAIERVPMEPLRARYPAFFIEEPRPTSGPNRPRPPRAIPVSQTARLGSPRKRCDPSNPLWASQGVHWKVNPDTKQYEYYSSIVPRDKYRHYKCHFCQLYGHIRWNCPNTNVPIARKHVDEPPKNAKANPIRMDGKTFT
jgi:hypothetical protein